MDRDLSGSGVAPNGDIESRFYVSQDALGSATATTRERQGTGALQVAEHYTYSAYGKVQVWTEAWQPQYEKYGGGYQNASTIGLPYLYTGQRLDAESGLYYFKNRPFDPFNGRFLRRDPLGYTGGPGLYEYSGGAPESSTDSLGLLSSTPSFQQSGRSYTQPTIWPGTGSTAPWSDWSDEAALERWRKAEKRPPNNGPPRGGNRRPPIGCRGAVSAQFGNCGDYIEYLGEKLRDHPDQLTDDQISDAEDDGLTGWDRALYLRSYWVTHAPAPEPIIELPVLGCGVGVMRSSGHDGITVYAHADPTPLDPGGYGDDTSMSSTTVNEQAANFARLLFNMYFGKGIGPFTTTPHLGWKTQWFYRCNSFPGTCYRMAGVSWPTGGREAPYDFATTKELANPKNFRDQLSWSKDSADIRVGTVVVWYGIDSSGTPRDHSVMVVGQSDYGIWMVEFAGRPFYSERSGLGQTSLDWWNQQFPGVQPVYRNWIGGP